MVSNIMSSQYTPASCVRYAVICVLCLSFGFPLFSDNTTTLHNEEAPDILLQRAQTRSLERLRKSTLEIANVQKYPCYGTKELQWQLRDSSDWTSGFYPGCLWLGFALSGQTEFAEWAKAWTKGIEKEKTNTQTHDLGFRFMCTYANQLRFAADDDSAKIKSIILEAADSMANRFAPAVGALSSNWDRWEDPRKSESVPVVIDIMMNLELLFWAAENGGPESYADIAETHARTTWNDFIRDDHGSYHVVRYQKQTGEVLDKGQLQGDKKHSTWSRGQAWAIYGYAVCFRYTKNDWYLERAQLLTEYFLRHLPPDRLAPWDFQSENTAKDVSASAIVCSAMFELAKLSPEPATREYYRQQAVAILQALSRPPAFAEGKHSPCILDLSTQYLPLGQNIEVPSIFADYYYLEALLRWNQSL